MSTLKLFDGMTFRRFPVGSTVLENNTRSLSSSTNPFEALLASCVSRQTWRSYRKHHERRGTTRPADAREL